MGELQASTTLDGKYVFPLIGKCILPRIKRSIFIDNIVVGVTIAMSVPLVIIAFKVDTMSAWMSRTALYRKFFKKNDG